MENELSSSMWEKMAEFSPDLFCTFDQEGHYVYISDACTSILGYTANELIGRHYTDFVHPDDLESTRETAAVILQAKKIKNFENCLIHKQGKKVRMLWSCAWSEQDNAIFCVARDITELKLSQKKLEESEQRYRALFENNKDVIIIESKEGLVTEVNRSFTEVLGFSKEQVINYPASNFLSAEVAALCKKYFRKALKGSTGKFNLDIYTTAKTLRTFEATKYPIKMGEKVIGVQTVAKDITPIVQSLDTIQQQAQKLSNIFESITDAFFMLDREWKFTYINREAARLLRLHKKKDIGKSIKDAFPEEVGGEFHLHYSEALKTGKAVHFTSYFREYDMWLQVKAFPSAEGLSVYFDDVTELIRFRMELEKLSLVASRTNNGVLIIDKNNEIEWANEGFTRLTGYTLEEALGKYPFDLLYNPKADQSSFLAVKDKMLNGEPVSFEVMCSAKSGEDMWINVQINSVLDEKGNVLRYIAVQTDITALKNSEQELAHVTRDLYNQNNDLQQFTYIVSHNLRAPVANALGLLNLLKKADQGTDVYDTILSNLKVSIMQLDTVLKDMNTILSVRDSKGNMELEEVDLNDVLYQVLSSLQEPLQKCSGEVLIDVEEGTTIKANKAYLYSVCHNLMSNAIKYRSDERHLEVLIKCASTNRGTLISFSDNGSGFDMEKVKDSIFKLYKRFHKGKKGRGIGLYLVKAHVESMGGHIEVSSQVGIGTAFFIYFPKTEKPALTL
ncbi:PAS domain S-box protein [Pontibacter sp. SGAir0037]|uniref:PAS domain-containing sensor histidine kinase n=1 Tax=Pontibacter sp. SGAir0037 TaxID=2571030 RepID=UPI0010CCB70E|nr:PAS domain S-box protein [Pontibacter sp. SGAir0037]QCR22740.1 PAS domain-containing sensor histidine kinase [Pontibacter sp. SGAir0037]